MQKKILINVNQVYIIVLISINNFVWYKKVLDKG